MKAITKKGLGLLLVLAVLVSLFAGCGSRNAQTAQATAAETAAQTASTEQTENDRDIVVLFTNDVHCGVKANLGYAGLSAYKKQMLAEGNYVALVDVGDAVQGDLLGQLSKGENIVRLMNLLGYDLAAVGNHEFDYGMEQFLKLRDMADFTYLCCNFIDRKTDKPVLEPYRILEFGSVKVGFVCVTTPETAITAKKGLFVDESGTELYHLCQDKDGSLLYSCVQAAVDAARAAGAQYVIGMGHLGLEQTCSPWMSTEVVENTTGMDVFLDGHSHSVYDSTPVKNKEGKTVLMAQTGTKLKNIGKLVITKDGELSISLISEVEGRDEAVEAAIAEMEAQNNVELSKVAGHTDYALIAEQRDTEPAVRLVRFSETNLGDLLADAFRAYGQADIGCINGAAIRENIPVGDITYGLLYKVQPYGNLVQTVEMTGQQLLDMLEWGVRYLPGECNSLMHVSGMTYEINTAIPSSVKKTENGKFAGVDGEYRVFNVTVGGEPLDTGKLYTVCSVNYILTQQGDGRTMLDGVKLVQNDGETDFNVLLDYIQNTLGGEIPQQYSDMYGQGRITIHE